MEELGLLPAREAGEEADRHQTALQQIHKSTAQLPAATTAVRLHVAHQVKNVAAVPQMRGAVHSHFLAGHMPIHVAASNLLSSSSNTPYKSPQPLSFQSSRLYIYAEAAPLKMF